MLPLGPNQASCSYASVFVHPNATDSAQRYSMYVNGSTCTPGPARTHTHTIRIHCWSIASPWVHTVITPALTWVQHVPSMVMQHFLLSVVQHDPLTVVYMQVRAVPAGTATVDGKHNHTAWVLRQCCRRFARLVRRGGPAACNGCVLSSRLPCGCVHVLG